jgi:hypothetical protein
MAAGRIPGSGSKKGPTRAPTPPERPSFIMGSRPENLRAPLPGAKIKPQAAGTRDYAKSPSLFDPDQGPM